MRTFQILLLGMTSVCFLGLAGCDYDETDYDYYAPAQNQYYYPHGGTITPGPVMSSGSNYGPVNPVSGGTITPAGPVGPIAGGGFSPRGPMTPPRQGGGNFGPAPSQGGNFGPGPRGGSITPGPGPVASGGSITPARAPAGGSISSGPVASGGSITPSRPPANGGSVTPADPGRAIALRMQKHMQDLARV